MSIIKQFEGEKVTGSKSLETKVKEHTSPAVEKLLFLFYGMQYTFDERNRDCDVYDGVFDKLIECVSLTPRDIACTVQRMGEQKSILGQDDYEFLAGEFIASMIKHSFAAGHNGFYIDAQSFIHPPAICHISGKERRKLKIEYCGPVPEGGFSGIGYANIVCVGDACDNSFESIHHCSVTVKGSVSDTMHHVEDSVVRIAGDAIDSFSCGENTRYIVTGSMRECFYETYQSRIYSPHRDVLNQLSNDSSFDTSNSLYKIGANGRSRKVWPK